MQICDVAIVGCGLGGLSTAIGIRRVGHCVTIYEKASDLHEIGAGIQLPYNCTRILKKWGILSAIDKRATHPSNVILRAYRDGHALFRRSLAHSESEIETPHLLLHRADFLKILAEEARRLGVLFRFGAEVVSIDFERPALHLSDGEHLHDAIFGADGTKSFCRGLLLGHSQTYGPQLSGDVAYRMMIPRGQIEGDEELSILIKGLNISCWMGPSAHVVCYQLKEESMLNVVLVSPDSYPGASADNTSAYRKEVETLFANWDPKLQKLFQLSNSISKTRLRGSHELATWSHVGGKFVLIGDACHTSLPHLAQGAAQAVEDGAVLGDLFAKIEEKGQIRDAIRLYEEIRKPRTSAVIKGSNRRRDMYQLEDGNAQQERDRELTQTALSDGYPNGFENLEFQQWLLNYDVETVVKSTWEQHHRKKAIELIGEHGMMRRRLL